MIEKILISLGVRFAKKRIAKFVRKRLEKRMKGSRTYLAVAGILLVQVGKLLGVEVAESDVAAITEGVLAIAAIYFRWLATRA
jgi:hypothetical protein